ncbi:hypothetical protein BN1723_005977 [Verticillium longisporum]|nr:hypothetical protein BN1723_005977 [Verticillium longisporum]
MVIVSSRRGAIEVRARVGGTKVGQVFLPFHFGYWDAKDGRARAANELTVERWDPISKQPTFKAGAVRIEKVTDTGKVNVPEPQSAAEVEASNKS